MSTKNLPLSKQPQTALLTRSHIVAMTFSTLFLSAITAAVGFQIGKTQSAAIDLSSATNTSSENDKAWLSSVLLPNIEKQENLETLLREIDQNRQLAANTDYLFPDELKSERTLPIPDTENIITDADDITEVPPANEDRYEIPEVDPNPLPTSGWSIQVGSYPTLEEAQSRAAVLKTEHPTVYVVTASVHGETWYRVRIAGYGTSKEAEVQREALSNLYAEFDYLVIKAP